MKDTKDDIENEEVSKDSGFRQYLFTEEGVLMVFISLLSISFLFNPSLPSENDGLLFRRLVFLEQYFGGYTAFFVTLFLSKVLAIYTWLKYRK